jgi:hypothetical protein
VVGNDGRKLLELGVEVAQGGNLPRAGLERAKVDDVGGPCRGGAAGGLDIPMEGRGGAVEGAQEGVNLPPLVADADGVLLRRVDRPGTLYGGIHRLGRAATV